MPENGGTRGDNPPNSSYPDYDAGEVVKSEDVLKESAPIYLEAKSESVELPKGSVGLTLHNNRSAAFETNFSHLRLHRWEDGRWWYVSPQSGSGLLQSLPGDGEHEWVAQIRNTDLTPVPIDDYGESQLRFRGLGGGSYAFSIDGAWRDTGTETVAATRVELRGEQVSVRPSELVTGTRREGSTVTVIADRYPNEDGGRESELIVRRTDGEPEERAITEQLLRDWPLREAMAQFEPDVDEVRVLAPTYGSTTFYDGVETTFGHDEETFSVKSQFRESTTETER
jgi:hypothetical protein